jgi:hypothetical protein
LILILASLVPASWSPAALAGTLTFRLQGRGAQVDLAALQLSTRDISDRTKKSILEVEAANYPDNGYTLVHSGTVINGFSIGNNQPTARQNCAGLALARLLGGPYAVDPSRAVGVLTTFGAEVSAPRHGDVAVWWRDGKAQHFALVDAVTQPWIGSPRVFVFSKDGQERVYRGPADSYPKDYGSVKYYRLPWHSIRAKRLAGQVDRPVKPVQPSKPGKGTGQYVVWSNDVGWIHVGTQEQFASAQTRGSEIWGGHSQERLKKTAMLGGKKFRTEAEAMHALAKALPGKVARRRAPLAFPKVYYTAGKLNLGFEIVNHPVFKPLIDQANRAK